MCSVTALRKKPKGFSIWQTWFRTVAKISGLFHWQARPSGEFLNFLELPLLCTRILCSDILCGSDSEFWCLLFLWALVHGCLFPSEPWDCCSEFGFLGTFSGNAQGSDFKVFFLQGEYLFSGGLQTQGHFKCSPWGLFFFQNTLVALCGSWALLQVHLWSIILLFYLHPISRFETISFLCCSMKSSLFLLCIHP